VLTSEEMVATRGGRPVLLTPWLLKDGSFCEGVDKMYIVWDCIIQIEYLVFSCERTIPSIDSTCSPRT
jgi:hypothetical protein